MTGKDQDEALERVAKHVAAADMFCKLVFIMLVVSWVTLLVALVS